MDRQETKRGGGGGHDESNGGDLHRAFATCCGGDLGTPRRGKLGSRKEKEEPPTGTPVRCSEAIQFGGSLNDTAARIRKKLLIVSEKKG